MSNGAPQTRAWSTSGGKRRLSEGTASSESGAEPSKHLVGRDREGLGRSEPKPVDGSDQMGLMTRGGY